MPQLCCGLNNGSAQIDGSEPRCCTAITALTGIYALDTMENKVADENLLLRKANKSVFDYVTQLNTNPQYNTNKVIDYV